MINKELLLKEDIELLEAFNKLEPLSTGLALEKQKLEMIKIQSEAFLRNRKSMYDIDQSNQKVQDAVLGLALIQIFISVIQIIFEMIPMNPNYTNIQSVVKIILFGGFIIYMFKTVFKEKK